ncbi:fungal specific transcription factor [Verticillium dahliae]
MEVSPGSTTISGRPRRRAVEACTFCRKRKIKCNNEQPTCANCRTYAKDCVYEPLTETNTSAQPRTSTRRRQRPMPAGQWCSSPFRSEPRNPDHGTDTSPTTTPRTGVSRIVVSANGVSSYHGRTSALYEDNVQERASAADLHPRMPEAWIEQGLVAEAATQRQLEDFNYQSGALDFDGVDSVLGMHLLSLHWNRQHHSFLITYRPAFMRDMACGGPYFAKLLLNAIYFGASKFSPRHDVRKDLNDVRTAGWEFRERVRELLGSALNRSDVTTIQALLVMTNSLFVLGDERSAAWLYAGLAFRMIIDLGMHVDVPDLGRKFSDEDLEIRRRVFWGAFVVDKIQSLYQGRPVTIKESDTLVPIKFLDTYEEFEHWRPFAYSSQSNDYPGSPAYSASTFTSLCRLSVAMSDILGCIYTERSFSQAATELSKMLETLNAKLSAWKESLPTHLIFDPNKSSCIPPPHVLSLHAMYHVLTILLHRPFVADGHLYTTSRSVSVNSFITCASAADSIVALLRAYDRAFTVRRAPYLVSYATYVAATIHARIAANGVTSLMLIAACRHVWLLMKRLGVSVAEGNIGSDVHCQNAPRSTAQPSSNNGTGNTDITTAPEHAEQAEIAVPDNISPSAGWSDIDGIIQSFVKGQDGLAAASEYQADLRHTDNFMPAQTAPIPPGGFYLNSEVIRPLDDRNLSDNTVTTWSTDIHAPGGTASIDDLLFGLTDQPLTVSRSEDRHKTAKSLGSGESQFELSKRRIDGKVKLSDVYSQ